MLSNALLLFFIIDPFGLIPVYLSLLAKVPAERRRRVMVRELLIALVALLLFLFAGKTILGVLHISEPAMTIAGALILFLIAVPMIFPSVRLRLSSDDEEGGEPFIVPMAVPLFAGPSALAMVMLFSTDPANGGWPSWLGSVLIAWAAASATLLAGERLAQLMGKRAIIALERLMGMLLVAISVEMVLGGIAAFRAGLLEAAPG